jgi:oligopeptide/dipeptide ABC transporter ATP-binding protein
MIDRASAPLLEIRDLRVEYPLGRRRGPLRAVDGVSLSIGPHETLGLVGESGSGKSTIGSSILGLAPIAHGTVRFAGEDITRASSRRRRELGATLQVIFQDPCSSLNPARTIGQTLSETLRPHGAPSRTEVADRMALTLRRVGLPEDSTDRFPAQFSGGQRQRIAIARALMVSPRLVVCDEPVSSLDVSVQAQVLNLLRELQNTFELSYLFISHDLAVVRRLAHRIAVLYHGRIMEYGDAATVHSQPAHPYTRALLAAVPVPDPGEQRRRRATRPRRPLEGVTPSGESCPFTSRCAHAVEVCRTRRPQLDLTPERTLVACHRWRELRERRSDAMSTRGDGLYVHDAG